MTTCRLRRLMTRRKYDGAPDYPAAPVCRIRGARNGGLTMSKSQMIARRLTKIARFGDYLAKKQGGWFCHYCHAKLVLSRDKDKPVRHSHRAGELPSLATIDHKLPLSKGGAEDDIKNMVLCCEDCNQDKGDMDYLDYWRLTEDKRT